MAYRGEDTKTAMEAASLDPLLAAVGLPVFRGVVVTLPSLSPYMLCSDYAVVFPP